MKIIDLLNKIAKSEEVPKKIIIKGEIEDTVFTFDKNKNLYLDDDYLTMGDRYNLSVMLNDEVEVLEEVEDKEYEDIGELDVNKFHDIDELVYKIDALIRNQKKILEQLKKEGNNE